MLQPGMSVAGIDGSVVAPRVNALKITWRGGVRGKCVNGRQNALQPPRSLLQVSPDAPAWHECCWHRWECGGIQGHALQPPAEGGHSLLPSDGASGEDSVNGVLPGEIALQSTKSSTRLQVSPDAPALA